MAKIDLSITVPPAAVTRVSDALRDHFIRRDISRNRRNPTLPAFTDAQLVEEFRKSVIGQLKEIVRKFEYDEAQQNLAVTLIDAT